MLSGSCFFYLMALCLSLVVTIALPAGVLCTRGVRDRVGSGHRSKVGLRVVSSGFMKSATVVTSTGIGFQFLHFGYSKRMDAQKGGH
jgi:hypothetical protein